MFSHAEIEQRPDVSGRQRVIDELKTRICKLRWIGLEDEAEREIATLRRLDDTAIVPIEPPETD